MLAVKYYDEYPDVMKHYYAMYTFDASQRYPIFQGKYVTDWNKDLTLDELRKATGNSISGIIDAGINVFYITAFEVKMADYLRFADEEFKKGKSSEQIDADWAKQQKIDDIKESAKEYTC